MLSRRQTRSPMPMFVLLHLLALALLVSQPQLWPTAVGLVGAVHLVMLFGSLWPRSALLGPNLIRLPKTAALRGEVSITIDDGPDPQVTPQVLEILARFNAHASFFCIGVQAAENPILCKRIVAEGHSVENHGQYHKTWTSLMGRAGWEAEVGVAQATLTNITGVRPRYFRALAGLRNPFLEPVLSRLGLQLTTWTRRGYDTKTTNPNQVFDRLMHQLQAGDILLLHDGHAARTKQGNPVILEILPRLLSELNARNLKSVTLETACKQN